MFCSIWTVNYSNVTEKLIAAEVKNARFISTIFVILEGSNNL